MKSIKFMKPTILMIFLVLTTQLTRAGFSFSGGGDIPDGNLAGLVSVGTVSGVSGPVTGMTLDLNVSGGFNGDLYAYLVAPNRPRRRPCWEPRAATSIKSAPATTSGWCHRGRQAGTSSP